MAEYHDASVRVASRSTIGDAPDDDDAYQPNTEVELVARGPYQGQRGIIIQSDPRAELVCVDVYRLPFPVWCPKAELRPMGLIQPAHINRFLWADLSRTP